MKRLQRWLDLAIIAGAGFALCHGDALRASDKPDPASIKAAVAKALPLLQKGATGHVTQRTCFACHNQTQPVLAITTAGPRGFAVDDAFLKKQMTHTHGHIARWAKANPDRKSFGGGQADTAGYALYTLELGGWKGDDMTSAVVDYLLQRDEDRGHWRNTSNRPPSEASPFTTTALAVRGLRAFGTPAQKEKIEKRVEAARGWLLKTKPKDTEERVFRLWGLQYAGAKPQEMEDASRDLLKSQRADGGWGQLDKLSSDAYATGSALTALHQTGQLPVSDDAYQRGLQFLLKDQKADGSWYVQSRSKPFQTYFETGFPHGKDQWISSAASGWATAALALALPPQEARQTFKNRKDVVLSCDFEDAEWWRSWGLKTEPANCTLLEGKSAHGGKGKSLKVTIPKGASTGANFHYRFRQQLGQEPEEMHFRYYIKLDPDWKNASDGGKLPGFSATYGKAGWGGRKVNGSDGWSARGHFKKPGADATEIGYYCYHADMKGKYGELLKFNPPLQYDRWYCIDMYCKLNSLGKDGEPGKKDGILKTWIDGKPAYERTDLRFRDIDKLKIESIWMNVYHGGTRPAPEDMHLYLDDIVVARNAIGP